MNLLSTSKDSSAGQRSPRSSARSASRDVSVSGGPSPNTAASAYRESQSYQTPDRSWQPPAPESTPFRDARKSSTETRSGDRSGIRLPRELEISSSEEDTLLQTYRSVSSAYFPFAIAHSHLKATGFPENRTFLQDVMHYVSTPSNYHRQMALGEQIMSEIASRLLLKPEKTTELLQGMLLFTAWCVLKSPARRATVKLRHIGITACSLSMDR